MKKNILIVDDALFMRKMVRKALEEIDAEILEADNGEKAIAVWKEKKPDLVFLDITMPGMSGIEVLEQMQSMNKESRIIMCSAIGQEEVIRRAVALGADDFVVKPFKKEEVLETAKRYLMQVVKEDEQKG